MHLRVFAWRIHRSSTSWHGPKGLQPLHHIRVRCNLIVYRLACSPQGTTNKFLSHIRSTVAKTKLGGSEVQHSRRLSRSMLRWNLSACGMPAHLFNVSEIQYLTSDALHRDTVSSVGIVPRTLPFTASNTSIRYFRHAISLDERRVKFKPNYNRLHCLDDQKGTKPGEMPPSVQSQWRARLKKMRNIRSHKDKVLPDEVYDDVPTATDVVEVWFAGCHSGNPSCLNVLMHLVLTFFCRHWWGISPKWHSEQLGQNPTSLDDPPMLSC